MLPNDWFDLPDDRRMAEYQRRVEALGAIVADVRRHRDAGPCSGAPLCPGGHAASKISRVPEASFSDLIITCLAGLVDRDEAIESLSASLKSAGSRVAGEMARLEGELVAARREADGGWEAYRLEQVKVANLTRDMAELAVRMKLELDVRAARSSSEQEH
jgi:hypothetical protein